MYLYNDEAVGLFIFSIGSGENFTDGNLNAELFIFLSIE